MSLSSGEAQNKINSNVENEMRYQCSFCCESFNKSIILKTHVMQHIPLELLQLQEKFQECFECGKQIEDISDPKKDHNHMQIQFKPKYSCDVCNKKFISSEDLHQHVQIHKDETNLKGEESKTLLHNDSELYEKKFKCPIPKCSLSFIKLISLVIHCRRNHADTITDTQLDNMKNQASSPEKHRCSFCSIEIPSMKFFLEHLNEIHKCDKSFQCSKCQLKFSKIQTLDLHIKNLHKSKKCECQNCGVTCKKLSTSMLHRRQIEAFYVNKCSDCNVSCAGLRTVRTHGCSQPNQVTPHKCCDIVKDLRLNTKDRQFDCDTCSKSFCHSSSLRKHQNIHDISRQHMCSICGKTFLYRNNLVVHIRSHTNERPFKCKICPKAFITSGHFSDHMKTHTQIKNYKCDLCEKLFLHQSSFSKHKRFVHLGIKPYKCKICNREFSQRGHYKDHLYIHSNEKRFVCEVCNKQFRRSDALKIHLNKHQNNNTTKSSNGLQVIKVQRLDPVNQYQEMIESIKRVTSTNSIIKT